MIIWPKFWRYSAVSSYQSPYNKLNNDIAYQNLKLILSQKIKFSVVPISGIVWEDGWHFNRGSNKVVENWAAQPFQGHSIALIGSGYNIRWNVWTEGAIVSSMNALVKHFDYHFDKCPCSLNSSRECYFPDKWPCSNDAASFRDKQYRFEW